jgi:hypothetical protein
MILLLPGVIMDGDIAHGDGPTTVMAGVMELPGIIMVIGQDIITAIGQVTMEGILF